MVHLEWFHSSLIFKVRRLLSQVWRSLRVTPFVIYPMNYYAYTHLSPQNDEPLLVGQCLLKRQHLLHGEIAANIRVQNKERSRVPTHYLVPEVVDAPSSSQGAIFLQVPDWYVVHLLHILYKPCHLSGLLVYSNQEDLLNLLQL